MNKFPFSFSSIFSMNKSLENKKPSIHLLKLVSWMRQCRFLGISEERLTFLKAFVVDVLSRNKSNLVISEEGVAYGVCTYWS